MRRLTVAIAIVGGLAALTPAPAWARLTEVGGSPTAQGRPSCPGRPCLAVSRTTGVQMLAAGRRDPYLVPRAGSIVAFAVALGKPTKSQIDFFNKNLGGASRARITVLRPYTRRGNNFRFVVRDQSEVFGLAKYFGLTAQFPLSRSLKTQRGDLIAFTVETWAPTLSVGLSDLTVWRASRSAPCDDTFKQTAQERIGGFTRYACEYKTARLTYSATLISTP